MEEEEYFKIVHPLNPNIKYKIKAPQVLIGNEAAIKEIEKATRVYLSNLSDPDTKRAFERAFDEIVRNYDKPTRDSGREKLLRLYALVLLLDPSFNQDVDPEWLEKEAHRILFGKGSKMAMFFSQPEEEEEEEEVIEQDDPLYLRIEVAVYRLLFPLYLFVGMIGIGSSDFGHYIYKGKGKSLRQVKSPTITDTENFARDNYFFGNKVLQALLANPEGVSVDYFWQNVNPEILQYVLNDKTLGAVFKAWDEIGKKYDSPMIYIYSETTRSKFADLVSYVMLQKSGGNAYPKRIDGGGRMNYYVSSGIKTRNQNEFMYRVKKKWFENVFKDPNKFELFKAS